MTSSLLAGIAVLAVSVNAAAASFDCAKASTPIEKMICSDSALSDLDGQLAQSYRSALDRATSVEATKAGQRAWLNEQRNRCTDVACLKLAYQRRIEVLAKHDGLGNGGAPPSFTRQPFISPRIINDLSTSLSDQGDQVVAINLSDSQGSNRYSGDIKTRALPKTRNPYVYATPDDATDGSEFGYRYIGRTTSGIDVLLTMESGGGSGTFENLMLVKVEEEASGGSVRAAADKTEVMTFKQRRVVLRKLGEIGLGDRWQGELKVSGNEITIGKDTGPQADASARGRVIKIEY